MTLELIVAGAAALLGAASLILHFVAPLTKTKKDDIAAEIVDKLKDNLPSK